MVVIVGDVVVSLSSSSLSPLSLCLSIRNHSDIFLPLLAPCVSHDKEPDFRDHELTRMEEAVPKRTKFELNANTGRVCEVPIWTTAILGS